MIAVFTNKLINENEKDEKKLCLSPLSDYRNDY